MTTYLVKARSQHTGRWVTRCRHYQESSLQWCATVQTLRMDRVPFRVARKEERAKEDLTMTNPFVNMEIMSAIGTLSSVPLRAWTKEGLEVREAAIRFVGASPNFTGASRNGAVYLKWAVGPDPTVKGTGAKFPADESGIGIFTDWLKDRGCSAEVKRGEGRLKNERVQYVWVYVTKGG